MQPQFVSRDANQAAIRAWQIAWLLRLQPAAMLAGSLLAVLVVLLLRSQGQLQLPLLWLGLLAGSKLWRLTIWRKLRQTDPGDIARITAFAPTIRLSVLLSGCAWGSSYVILYPAGDVVMQLLMALMLAGISAGAATSMAADRTTALLFQLPILLPMAAQALIERDTVHHALAIMIGLHGAFVCGVILRLNRDVVENIVMRLRGEQREHELQASELRYRQLAHADSLTGLPNRTALLAALPDLLTRADAAGQQVALFYIDVDHFKDINDSHGHAFGDQVISALARRLKTTVGPDDLVARIGGDEFAIATRAAATTRDGSRIADQLRASLRESLPLELESVHGSACIGVAFFPQDASTVGELLVNAEVALYQAKAQGQGKVVTYDASMSAGLKERRALELALRRALGTQQLFVQYQPVVRIDSGTPVSLEALVRWRHPERGLMPPATFVPIAERFGMEDLLGEHVLRAVCRQLRAWLDDLVPVVPVAINVSPRQFERGHLIELLSSTCREFSLDPALLQVEVTESALMQNVGNQLHTLQQLRAQGIRVAIDDFGTGYSSLSYLKNLPIDALKIDRSFVNDMTQDARDIDIVRAIVTIGKSLAIEVVAEGVETAAQAATLLSLDCQVAQGYHFHRPMDAESCTALLRGISANNTAESVDSSRHGMVACQR